MCTHFDSRTARLRHQAHARRRATDYVARVAMINLVANNGSSGPTGTRMRFCAPPNVKGQEPFHWDAR